MKNGIRKYILIILMFMTSLLCAVGASTWIILSEQTAKPSTFDKIDTIINIDGVSTAIGDTTIYYGENYTFTDTKKTLDNTILENVKVYAGDVDITSFGTLSLTKSTSKITGESTGTNASADNVTGSTTIKFVLKSEYADTYNAPTNNEKASVSVKMYAVAKIGSNKFYSTIDQALSAATSGNTITVIPSDYATETEAKRVNAKTIGITGASTLEVKSGVTLALPYDLNSIPSTTYGEDTTGHHPSAYTDTTKIKNIITVSENITLNNYGKIKVYGKISGGNGGKAIASVTSADHARIIMNKNAQIISKKESSLECYGYIVESSSNNSSKITIENGSKLSMMFTIVEHRGGTNFSNIYYDKSDYDDILPCSPFTRFYLENITSRLRIDYGGRLTGHADLCGRLLISTQHNHTDINLIGVTTDSTPNLIELENSNSYVEAKHNGDTTDENYKVTDLKIFGNAEINSLEMKIISPTISTANIFFPVSWYYNITLAGNNSTVTFNNQHIKILPGAKVTIEQGVTVDIGDLIVYNGFRDTLVGQPAGSAYEYNLDSNGNPISGTLIVNGTLIADNLAGKIFSKSESAKITINNATTLDSRELESDSPSYYTKTENLSLNLYDTTTNTVSETMTTSGLTKGTYFSIKDTNNNFGWGKRAKLTINYDTDEYSGVSGLDNNPQEYDTLFLDTTYTLTKTDLPELKLNQHYTFDGWYFDEALSDKADVGDPIELTNENNTIILYPKFTPIDYTIEYIYTGIDGADYSSISKPSQTTFNIESGDITFPTNMVWEGKPYKFTGWYYDSELKNGVPREKAIDFETLFSYTKNGTLTLYGNWAEKEYTVTFITDGEHDYSIGTLTSKPANSKYDPVQDNEINNKVIAYDNVTNKLYYFGGWYTDEALETAYDPTVGLTEENTTLYAKWVEKITVNKVIDEVSTLVGYYIPNATIKTENTITKTGYIFTHWDITNVGEVAANTEFILHGAPGSTVNITAAFEKLVTVTINLNGGTSNYDLTQYVRAGESFIALDNPTQTGYTFAHWSIMGGSHDGEFITDTAISLSEKIGDLVKLTAEWNIIEYNITYTFKDLATGVFTPTNTYATTYTITDTIGLEKSVTLTDDNGNTYTVIAWYSDADYKTEISEISGTGNKAVYAKCLNTQYRQVDITFTDTGKMSSYGVKYGTTTINENGTYYIPVGTELKVTAEKSGNYDAPKIEINAVGSPENNTYIIDEKDEVITITVTGQGSCIVEGTLITLADGTQKPIENVTANDKVLIFNHLTGKMESGQILFTSHGTEEENLYRIVNLQFSDGSTLRIVQSHGLFDLDLNKYVYLKETNYNDYIGHRFYKSEFNGTEFVGGEITLTNAFITEEVVRIFCPVTAFHMNCFAESLLTMPNIPYNEDGLVNFFEFGEGLKYDEEKMQADIEKYGLYSYEDFAEYFSYEAFISSPAVYLKISIGKGLITFDEILLIIDYLLNGNYIS